MYSEGKHIEDHMRSCEVITLLAVEVDKKASCFVLPTAEKRFKAMIKDNFSI